MTKHMHHPAKFAEQFGSLQISQNIQPTQIVMVINFLYFSALLNISQNDVTF